MADYSIIIMIVAAGLLVGIFLLTYKDMPLIKLFKKWFSGKKNENTEESQDEEVKPKIKVQTKEF